MTRRSINAHEIRLEPRGGQVTVSCKCALLLPRKFNREGDAERYHAAHVQRAERSVRR